MTRAEVLEFGAGAERRNRFPACAEDSFPARRAAKNAQPELATPCAARAGGFFLEK